MPKCFKIRRLRQGYGAGKLYHSVVVGGTSKVTNAATTGTKFVKTTDARGAAEELGPGGRRSGEGRADADHDGGEGGEEGLELHC